MTALIHQLLQLQIEKKGYENLIFSPLSLEMLLGLILPGTQGKSREALLEVLEITEAEVNSYLAELQTISDSLLASQSGEENSTKVQLANSLWHRGDIRPKADYKRIIKTRFPFELFPFSDPVEATIERINQWANENTNGLIPELPIQLDQDSIIVLLNALYLKGFWSCPFLPQEDDIFYTLEGGETSSQYMYLKQDQVGNAQAQYLKKEQFHALRLMFKDGRIGLEVYLPYENTGLKTFLEQLAPDDFDQWKNEFTEAPYFYFLMPKFEISDSFQLSQVADQLGIAPLFTPSKDLNPLLESDLPLNFNEIGQEAKIKVTEEGLEAAVVSFGVAVATGIPQEGNPMIIFEADHPFLYRVVDIITDQVLFQGIFTTPVHTPNAFVQHLNKRLYSEYEQNATQLTDKERFVVILILIELMLDQYPWQHPIFPNLLDTIWQTLTTQPDFSNAQVVEDFKAYADFQINYIINTEYDHLKEYKYWGFGEELAEPQVEAMLALSGMFEMDESLSEYNCEEFMYGLRMIYHQGIQLPSYAHLEQLLKQKQQNGLFQRIALSELNFDEVPTEIVYTEEEKQEKAQAKKALEAYQQQRAEALKLDQLDEKIKIGLVTYAIAQLRNQLGENYEFMHQLLQKLWQYLANHDENLKKEASEIIIWMLEPDGFEAYPGTNYKAKFHLKFIRKNYSELMPAVRILLSQLIAPTWEWEYQSIRELESIFTPETMPFPNLDIFAEAITESLTNQPNLVLDYDFFDQIAETIKSTQEDLGKYLN